MTTKPSRPCSLRRRAVPGGWPRLLALGVVGGLAHGLLVRPWQLRWGATADEANAPLAGDDLVPGASYVTTRVVTVRAPPEGVRRSHLSTLDRGGIYQEPVLLLQLLEHNRRAIHDP